MAAATDNLIIDKGATFKKTYVYQDSSRNPIDLTGYTAKMQIRPYVGSSTVIVELSTANGRITITPLEGEIELNLSKTDTESIVENSGVYDLDLIDSSSEPIKLVRGTVTFVDRVTE